MKNVLRPFTYRFGILAVLIIMAAFSANAQKTIPELWGVRVHDEAKVLSQKTIDQLELQLKKYEDTTTNQIAILIIPSLDGEVLEQYSIRVVEHWKLGTKKNDNGALLLVVVNDHKMRIEVGQGLEGVLTDAQSNRIIRNEMAPNFRKGDYDAGVLAAVNAMTKAIAGEYVADDAGTTSGEKFGLPEHIVGGIIIFGLLGVFTFMAVFSKGCAGWGLYVFLIPFYAIFPTLLIGNPAFYILLLYIIGVPIAKIILGKSKWGQAKMAKWQSKSGSGGGWWMGSGWGGGGSGGGFSGFSGGGGSFGGGGSSGSW